MVETALSRRTVEATRGDRVSLGTSCMGMLATSKGEGEGRIGPGMRAASQLAKVPAA
jgi:hypothetical protein